MSDLISRSALIEALRCDKESFCSHVFCHTGCQHGDDLMMDLEVLIESQPTVDAVEVVRCKDCENYIPRKRSCRSEYLNGCTIPNGYCFNGVRKKVN